jgi:hypothetical protein
VKPPVRWLEANGEAPSGTAELLSAASPVPAFTDALRYRLGVGVAKTATLPVTSTWTALVAKGALVVSLGGASGYAVHSFAGHHDATTLPPAPAQAVVSPQVSTEEAAPAPIAVEALPALQLPTAPASAPRLKVDPRLEEAELLEKARALVGSSPGTALKLTQDHARDFPRGRLGAEADLIASQALLAMGKSSAAKARAKASLSRYPSGLYARQLREIVER